jgi:undecaprenyl-diphosphatase
MLGAASYDLFRNYHLLSQSDISALVVGFAGAFVSALSVVSALVRFIATHSLRVFPCYRIVLGFVIVAWLTFARA